jgi:transposase
MSTARRTYSKEFKEEALALLTSSGKSMWALEQELGLSHGLLRQWKQQAAQAGEQAFPGHGNLKADDAELRALRREVEILRQERDILKKAISIFSQEVKSGTK